MFDRVNVRFFHKYNINTGFRIFKLSDVNLILKTPNSSSSKAKENLLKPLPSPHIVMAVFGFKECLSSVMKCLFHDKEVSENPEELRA